MQQQRFHNICHDQRDPRHSTLEDLGLLLDNWLADGDQIVLLADMNSNVDSAYIKEWCQSHQLKEAITSRHKEAQGLQATYHKGSAPIDGIFVSSATKGRFPLFSFRIIN